jgi:murein DD-endopeptidase MepM/ murein hydrolase activator NlpD
MSTMDLVPRRTAVVAALVLAAVVLAPVASATPARATQSSMVRSLQLTLAQHGFPSGPIDGRYGPRLTAAVRRFQRSVGLPADGAAGPATLAALRRPAAHAPFLLAWPVLAQVGDHYGPRGDRFHAGVDLLAANGTAVEAAAPGTVTWAGERAGGWGLLVVVRHRDGVRTMYAHLQSISVNVGDAVAGGAILGHVGATGDATGPHLHFEVRVHGAAVDPLSALVPLN